MRSQAKRVLTETLGLRRNAFRIGQMRSQYFLLLNIFFYMVDYKFSILVYISVVENLIRACKF